MQCRRSVGRARAAVVAGWLLGLPTTPGVLAPVLAGSGNADVVVAEITGVQTWGTLMTCRASGKTCSTDADCTVCSTSGQPCDDGDDCGIGEACAVSGDMCDVEVAAFSVGSAACNAGDVPLKWCDFPSQYCSANEHPVIAQNMYRLHQGRFEQIGLSWVKHGFAAVDNSGCGVPCQPAGTDDLLGIGCWDVYGQGLNGTQSYLGPRSEVNANTGSFPYPYVLQAGASGDALFKRAQVRTADLHPALNAGARYLVEAHYVSAHDAADRNGNNNASYREVTITGPTELNRYLAYITGGTIDEQPAIRAWQSVDPTVVETDIQIPNEGLFILAAKVTPLDTGFWRYEYALFNLNSDRSAGSFFVPLPLGAITQQNAFHGVPHHSGEPYARADWDTTVSGPGITWAAESYEANPNANALRWSTLYNFRFETNAPPAPELGPVTIGLFKPGAPGSVAAMTVVPLLDVIDCNDNGVADDADIADETSADCDGNGVPDECQADCNGNVTADTCDLASGASLDCNLSGVPDECEPDCDGNGRPDVCDIAVDSTAPGGPFFCITDCDPDCNDNGVPDACDPDCNDNAIPDGCYGDPVGHDTDGDGTDDCTDLCPELNPPVDCTCPPEVCCAVPGFGDCFVVVPWQTCIDFFGGTPACMPSDLCRDGCLVGDINADGVLDLSDWAGLQGCFSGSAGAPGFDDPSADCARVFDFDGDGAVDSIDHARWLETAASEGG